VTVKRQKRLRLNKSDWVLRFGRLSLLNFLNVAMIGHPMKCSENLEYEKQSVCCCAVRI